jgi:hypothetical protein
MFGRLRTSVSELRFTWRTNHQPYSFMRRTTGGFSTTPTPKGFRVITAGTRMGHNSQMSFQPGKIFSSNIKVRGGSKSGAFTCPYGWIPHTSQGA